MIFCGEDKYQINLNYFNIGSDLLVVITGGEEHIGAISLLENGSFSTIGKVGHKDNVLSKKVAPKIYDALQKDVVVICGIHIDNAMPKDIKILSQNVDDCVEEFLLMY